MSRLQSRSVMATVVVLHLAIDLLFSPLGWLGCEALNLTGADITDAVIPHAKTLTGLKHLDLRRTGVTEAGTALQRAATRHGH